jgi:predicted transcriptional regulator
MEPQEAIHNRAEKRRTTVIRMAEQGRKQKDIAKALGITPARVCQLLKAARTSRN